MASNSKVKPKPSAVKKPADIAAVETVAGQKWRIETPVKIGRTTRCGVLFVNGEAETADPALANQCRSQGYKVTAILSAALSSDESSGADESGTGQAA